MYQFATSSWPSGLARTQSWMVSLRKRRVSGSERRSHLVDPFHFLLRADSFIGMQSAIDPNNGFAFAGEGMRLVVSQIFRVCELLRDLFVAVEAADVFRRADNHHVLMAAFGGKADIDQFQAVGFGGELFPIRLKLRVAGHLIVVAQVEAKGFFRSGDGCGS